LSETIWSTDPENVINKKIKELYLEGKDSWNSEPGPDFVAKARELFELGFKDGQHYVWNVRAGNFIDKEGNPVDIYGNPRDTEEKVPWVTTTNNCQVTAKTYIINKDGNLEEVKDD